MKDLNSKKLRDRITEKLERWSHLRDDDNQLIREILQEDYEQRGGSLTDNSVRDFMYYFGRGALTSTESIRRTRAKIQSEREDLRGKKYKARHENQENVKESLEYLGTKNVSV